MAKSKIKWKVGDLAEFCYERRWVLVKLKAKDKAERLWSVQGVSLSKYDLQGLLRYFVPEDKLRKPSGKARSVLLRKEK